MSINLFPNMKRFFSLFLAAVMMVTLHLVPVREPGEGGRAGSGQADRLRQHHNGLFTSDVFIVSGGGNDGHSAGRERSRRQ